MKNIVFLFALFLVSCNGGDQIGTPIKNIPAAEQKSMLKNHNTVQTDLSILGSGVEYVPNKPESTFLHLNDAVERFPFDANKIKVIFGQSFAQSKVDIVANGVSNASSIFASASIKGSLGLLSASMEFSTLSAEARDAGAITIVSDGGFKVPLSVETIGESEAFLSKLTIDARGRYMKGKGGDWGEFTEYYGNGYVKTINLTTSYKRIISVKFNNEKLNDEMKLKAELGYGSLVGIQAVLNTLSSEDKRNVNITIRTEEKGIAGCADMCEYIWGKSKDAPPIPASCMTVESLNQCASDVAKADDNNFKIFTNTVVNRVNQFNNQSDNTLANFSKQMGVLFAVDDDLTTLRYKMYPDVGEIDDKSDLAVLQQQLISGIRTVAALGKDSSFMNVLTQNQSVGNVLKSLEGFSAVLENVQKIQAINNSILGQEEMLALTSKCFTATSTKKSCEEYINEINTYKWTDAKGDEVKEKLSILDYIGEAELLSKNAVFKIDGYLSSTTPQKANIFWLPIKNESFDYLVPIYLNSRYSDRAIAVSKVDLALLNDYKTINGLSSNRRLTEGDKVIIYGEYSELYGRYLNFLPLPNDLLIKVGYNAKGIIEDIQRDSHQYQDTDYLKNFTGCRIANGIDVNNPSRNKDYKQIVICNDDYSKKYNLEPPSFVVQKIPFYNSLQYTFDKAVTDYGFHSAGIKTDAHGGLNDLYQIGSGGNIEAYSPWCSPNGVYCLEYNVGTGELKETNGSDSGKNIATAYTGQKGAFSLKLLHDGFYYGNKHVDDDVIKNIFTDKEFPYMCDVFKIADNGKTSCVTKDALMVKYTDMLVTRKEVYEKDNLKTAQNELNKMATFYTKDYQAVKDRMKSYYNINSNTRFEEDINEASRSLLNKFVGIQFNDTFNNCYVTNIWKGGWEYLKYDGYEVKAKCSQNNYGNDYWFIALPGKKYKISEASNGSIQHGVECTNWKDWEKNSDINKNIKSNAGEFDKLIISDEGGGSLNIQNTDWDTSSDRMKVLLKQEGRKELGDAITHSYVSGGGAHWVDFYINTTTRLPVPLIVRVCKGNCDYRLIYGWKEGWTDHFTPTKYGDGGGIAEICADINGDSKCRSSWTMGMWHNNNSIRIYNK